MTKYDLKRKISAARKSRGSGYPVELQEAASEYAELRNAAGLTFRQVAAELGINWHTLMGWRKRMRRPKKALRRVKIVKPSRPAETEASARAITVHFPGGVTVDGLDIPQVAELMRSLS